MATPEVITRPSTLSQPKTTLLAIDHLIDHLSEPAVISMIGKAVGQISGFGVDKKLDTVLLAVEITGNQNMARLIECLTNNPDESEVAMIIGEIIIATSWKCLRDSTLSSRLTAFVSMAQQINAIPGTGL
jgi:hypothetical protein